MEQFTKQKSLITQYFKDHSYNVLAINLCSGSSSVFAVSIEKPSSSLFFSSSSSPPPNIFSSTSTSQIFNIFSSSSNSSPTKYGSPNSNSSSTISNSSNNSITIAVKLIESSEVNLKEIQQYQKAIQFVHPNVLRTLQDFNIKQYKIMNEFTEKEEQFVVVPMEYIPKGRLTEICGKIKEPMVWNVLSQLTSAMAYIYYGDLLVHRAVTPSNVLIKSLNVKENHIHVVLSHFNSMRHVFTRNTVSHNDWETEAPEVLQGFYTTYSDIYSLGMTIYKLCLGDRLPKREQLDEHLFNRGFSNLLINLLKRMTDQQVLNRYSYLELLLHCKLYKKTFGISLVDHRGAKYQFHSKMDDISSCETLDSNNNFGQTLISPIRTHFVIAGQPVIVEREINFPQNGGGEYLNVKRGELLLVHDVLENGWLECQKVKIDAETPGSLETGKVYYDLVSLCDEHVFKSRYHPIQ